MLAATQPTHQYITDENGNEVSIILPVDDYRSLSENRQLYCEQSEFGYFLASSVKSVGHFWLRTVYQDGVSGYRAGGFSDRHYLGTIPKKTRSPKA